MKLLSFAWMLALGTTALVRADAVVNASANWAQWRGPEFNGSARASGLPATLTKESARWISPLPGKSGATPIVWENKIFVSTPDSQKNLLLQCLDRMSGKVLWEKQVGVGDKDVGKNNMTAPSPVTDGKRVIALYGTGDIAAFDLEGNPLWARNLGKDYGHFAIMWLYGSSPILFENQLIVQVLQRDEMPKDYPLFDGKSDRESFLLSLDPATGKEKWRSVRKTDSTKESHESYATPIPYKSKNGWELLVAGGDHVSGHRPTDGHEIWRARIYEKRDDWYRIVTSPVAYNGLIFASGPKGQPVVAFKEGAKGDVTGKGVAWQFNDAPTDWATPLILDGKLFILDGNKKVLSRLDPKTGAKEWTGKLDSDVMWSSPTGADGKIYMTSEKGTVWVVDAGNEFKILSRLDLDEGPTRSSVVVAHNQLFVRTAKNLYCFGK